MSGFLANLVSRSRGAANAVRPRLSSLFEPGDPRESRLDVERSAGQQAQEQDVDELGSAKSRDRHDQRDQRDQQDQRDQWELSSMQWLRSIDALGDVHGMAHADERARSRWRSVAASLARGRQMRADAASGSGGHGSDGHSLGGYGSMALDDFDASTHAARSRRDALDLASADGRESETNGLGAFNAFSAFGASSTFGPLGALGALGAYGALGAGRRGSAGVFAAREMASAGLAGSAAAAARAAMFSGSGANGANGLRAGGAGADGDRADDASHANLSPTSAAGATLTPAPTPRFRFEAAPSRGRGAASGGATEPIVEVSIGRIEVRAVVDRDRRGDRASSATTSPVMGLDEYLRTRVRGGGSR